MGNRYVDTFELAYAYGAMHGDAIVNGYIPRAKEAGLRSVTVKSLEVIERHRDDIRCDVFDWASEYFDGIERQLACLPPWQYKVKRTILEFVITW